MRPQLPVVFDESQNRALIGDPVIHIMLFGKWRNHQEWQTRPITAAARCAASRSHTAGSRPSKLIVGDVRLHNDRPHLVVVPTVGIVIRNDHRGFVPLVVLH